MGKQVIRIGILFVLCLVFISACASTVTTTAPVDATVAALSTKVAQQDTIISYLATRVDISRAGTPTPSGFFPTMTPYLLSTPSAITIIEYSRTGGIVGYNDNLKIDANRHVTVKRRNVNIDIDLTANELNQLQLSLRDANFAAIPENSMPKALVPDEISYVIVYQGHTIRTSDTAMPTALQPIIVAFNALIDGRTK